MTVAGAATDTIVGHEWHTTALRPRMSELYKRWQRISNMRIKKHKFGFSTKRKKRQRKKRRHNILQKWCWASAADGDEFIVRVPQSPRAPSSTRKLKEIWNNAAIDRTSESGARAFAGYWNEMQNELERAQQIVGERRKKKHESKVEKRTQHAIHDRDPLHIDEVAIYNCSP